MTLRPVRLTDTLPRILYIDDDDGLRTLAKRSLSRRGFDVSLAASGAEGIDRAVAEPFDIIAVDHYMPELDGLATPALVRALADAPPVIYVTGSEETAVAVAALKAGAIDYIVKTVGNDFFDLLANAGLLRRSSRSALLSVNGKRKRLCRRATPASRLCCTRSITALQIASRSFLHSFTCNHAR
jgi:DNA-binding response OmpR family regulator